MSARVRILLTAGALLLSACAGRPPAAPGPETYTGDGGHPVYVVGHYWHTGFIVPASDVVAALPRLGPLAQGAGYFKIGWGDAGFYQARRVRSGLAFRALLLSTETVVRVAPVASLRRLRPPPDALFRLCLTDTGLDALLQFIAQSFRRDDDGFIIPSAEQAPGHGRFYAGIGDYHLFNTCNTWTAKGLASAGFDVSAGAVLTAGQLIDYLRAQDPVPVVPPFTGCQPGAPPLRASKRRNSRRVLGP